MAGDFDSVVAAATKILGPKIKVPKPSGAVDKARKENADAYKKFDKTRNQLENDVLNLQKSVSSFALALKQYGEQIEKSDLGCDSQASDYKKKRVEAQKLFDAYFMKQADTAKRNIKNADELDKHLMNIADYKSPPDTDV